MRNTIPLNQRRIDWIYLGFFFINLFFITYIVDLEQLVIRDPSNFKYPIWPLPFFVDMVHWWGTNFDPLQWYRPVWWKATIWLDVIIFGPYYAVRSTPSSRERVDPHSYSGDHADPLHECFHYLQRRDLWSDSSAEPAAGVACQRTMVFIAGISRLEDVENPNPFTREIDLKS